MKLEVCKKWSILHGGMELMKTRGGREAQNTSRKKIGFQEQEKRGRVVITTWRINSTMRQSEIEGRTNVKWSELVPETKSAAGIIPKDLVAGLTLICCEWWVVTQLASERWSKRRYSRRGRRLARALTRDRMTRDA